MIDDRICCERIVVEHSLEWPPTVHRVYPWELGLSKFTAAERALIPIIKDLPTCLHGHGKCADKLVEKVEGRVGREGPFFVIAVIAVLRRSLRALLGTQTCPEFDHTLYNSNRCSQIAWFSVRTLTGLEPIEHRLGSCTVAQLAEDVSEEFAGFFAVLLGRVLLLSDGRMFIGKGTTGRRFLGSGGGYPKRGQFYLRERTTSRCGRRDLVIGSGGGE